MVPRGDPHSPSSVYVELRTTTRHCAHQVESGYTSKTANFQNTPNMPKSKGEFPIRVSVGCVCGGGMFGVRIISTRVQLAGRPAGHPLHRQVPPSHSTLSVCVISIVLLFCTRNRPRAPTPNVRGAGHFSPPPLLCMPWLPHKCASLASLRLQCVWSVNFVTQRHGVHTGLTASEAPQPERDRCQVSHGDDGTYLCSSAAYGLLARS